MNTESLRELLKLSERKENLLHELKNLEEQIISYFQGHSLASSKSTFKKKREEHSKTTHSTGQRASRGKMKTQILTALQEAGATGMKVSDIAEKIGAKSANVHVWFSNTGKKLPEIERIGAGHFRIHQNREG